MTHSLQSQRVRNMNMCARRHRYISAAAAALRLFMSAVSLRRRQRHQQLQHQQAGLASHRHYSLRSAFTAWFSVHCRHVRKRINVASSSSHFRRITLTRIMSCLLVRARRARSLRVFAAAAAAVCSAALMQKSVGGWLELRWGWRDKRQR